MRPLVLTAGCLGLLLQSMAASAAGAAVRVDESGTFVRQPVASMRWRHPVPGRAGADHTLETLLHVDVRLRLERWMSRPARLYLVLAATNDADIRVRWTTEGRLAAGEMKPGSRALVFEGIPASAVLTDTMKLYVSADGRRLSRLETLDFHFEIEAQR